MKTIFPLLCWTLSFVDVHVLGLSICPSDSVISIGQTVTLVCATLPGKQIRWSAKSPDNIIFNGKTMYYEYGVSGRFNATPSNDGQVELNITGVQLEDAGLYGCHSLSTREEVHAELIVIDSASFLVTESIYYSPDDLNQSSVEHSCSLKFTGNVRPTIEWLDIYNNTIPFLNTSTVLESVRDGLAIVHKVNVSYHDRSSWPDTCRVTFTLKTGCAQAFTNVSFSFQSPTGYYIRTEAKADMQVFANEHLIMYGIHIVLFAILVTFVCWTCILRRQWTQQKFQEAEASDSTKTSPESDSFINCASDPASQDNLHMYNDIQPTNFYEELKTNHPPTTGNVTQNNDAYTLLLIQSHLLRQTIATDR